MKQHVEVSQGRSVKIWIVTSPDICRLIWVVKEKLGELRSLLGARMQRALVVKELPLNSKDLDAPIVYMLVLGVAY